MLAKYLKKRFEENDLHNALVARKLKTSRAVVGMWVKGETVPSFENCCKIAELIATKEHRSIGAVLAEMKEQMSLKGGE